jgi:hypothetical protein
MKKDIILAEWPNAAGNVIRVRVCKWRGKIRLDIREFYRRDGVLRPGQKGVSIDPRRRRALGKAVKSARVHLKNAKS